MGAFRVLWPCVLAGWLMSPAMAAAAAKCERLIASGSPDAPPYLWRDPQDPRQLMGANADLLRQAAQELGITVEVLYAGKRSQAQEEVRSGRMDLLVDASLNSAQLEAFDYLQPAISHNEIVLWTRADSGLAAQSLADLQGLSGVRSQRTRLTPEFEALAGAQLQLQTVGGLTAALQKLALGEVDYALAGRYAGRVLVESLGLAADLQALGLVVDRPGFHLALSSNSACNDPWLRGQLTKKMTESAASGLADEAIKRNLDLWKRQLQQPVSKQ
ncbi:transporter substrate-binding domain-containing protein [Pseudomonas sp. LJDD11]|uniref:substrate-binding periplasmic protein n=1 Tax=Pseudomonas sp. LJDD11 TaxID=2931984 RepID=UPI00211CAFA4|nr:transporter substrate-binding domain-containing protein [Pseudomonas sp. LJDD11]MCQ9423176.1 transporter substrate-binding domain-containing protein [Pseudomonas sp. LJDD11]